jgi:hypothetical protein
MLLRVFAELVNRMSQIRCEWTIDVRLELSQVDFDDLKIIDKYWKSFKKQTLSYLQLKYKSLNGQDYG